LIQLIDAGGAPFDWIAAGETRTYRAMLEPEGLEAIREYAAGIGVAKELVQPIRPDGSLGPATSLVERAHAEGLLVHVWTLRADSTWLPPGYRGDAGAEGRRFRDLDVDGVFTDFPDVIREGFHR
jgi:glycerophosphoryl diester phosphodiesterase